MDKYDLNSGLSVAKVGLSAQLPPAPEFDPKMRRAPARGYNLSREETVTAVKNALRYVPIELHEKLAPEFLNELMTRGRIYGYRYRPQGRIHAKPVDEYQGNCLEGRALQVMIDNNLDFAIALYPYELVTYGEGGQVFQNWMQYRLVKKYLETMTDHQTLVIQSGHPLGLFPSKPDQPRVINTNTLMVGMFDDDVNFRKAAAMGVANYGQMTAGGWMYIGPQGIVHGTAITLLNAGRLFLGVPATDDLRGVTFVTSGLGGMSGAQAKAIEIAGGVGIIAEVDSSRILQRKEQGWLSKWSDNLDQVVTWMKEAAMTGEAASIGYHGNIVDLWEYLKEHDIQVDLASDQTSCHAVYDGGYTPQGISFEEGRELLNRDREGFKRRVDASLKRQFALIKVMTQRGTRFWDYGNSFMKAVFDAGQKDIATNTKDTSQGFIFPSYVEDIMGPLNFDFGYGPFRWVCLSGRHDDLLATDQAAMACIDPQRRAQDRDNYEWIKNADSNNLVVGSQARILYADAELRVKIGHRFNKMVREGAIGPVLIGRDHHDTGSADSPFRETADISDGSRIMADMSSHNFAGNAARGMSLVVMSNGGGVGIGKAIHAGFGLVLDGSERVDSIIESALTWDVMGGVARRAWARNKNAVSTAVEWNIHHEDVGTITIPYLAEEGLVEDLVDHELG
jgi:urocanate hydratase